jgi:L-2-hydroxyglutarate oxidase LhgO
MGIFEANIAIVGAGVVGLAVAAETSRICNNVYVFEQNHTFGLETSSRNSQVIHAGIYYPPETLKARLCVEGKHLLYTFCERYGVGYRKTGKIVIASDESEIEELEEICQLGLANGVDDLTFLSRSELKVLEPDVKGKAGLLSPSTGIIDCYGLMALLHKQATEAGAKFVFDTEVIGIEQTGENYRVQIKEGGDYSDLLAHIVINAAGLGCDRLAHSVGIDIDTAGYRLHYCRGEYFNLNPGGRYSVKRLVYPVPRKESLGIHVTPTLEGGIRLGPDARYIDELDYSMEDSQKETFYSSVKRFLPPIELEDLSPDFVGIRPKLQAPDEDFRDFVIAHEADKGLPGLINLIGIESPGLTACLAIAKRVECMVRDILA